MNMDRFSYFFYSYSQIGVLFFYFFYFLVLLHYSCKLNQSQKPEMHGNINKKINYYSVIVYLFYFSVYMFINCIRWILKYDFVITIDEDRCKLT